MKKSSCVFAVMLSLLSGCSLVADRHIEWETVEPGSFPVLKAVGYAPMSQQPGSNDQERMLLAMKASKLEAYRELAEQVYGQRINAEANMQQVLIGDDQLNASVSGIIRGARVVKTYPVGDIYATELELDFKQVYELYLNSQPTRRIKNVKYY
ncbi:MULTISPECIES: LPP20 family lipoprotein [Rheinheimera]|uniref:LPP20 family lipoprotein n=1 Tax=Rheinheimera marina TaxID=1774958 RepID=A0ABV9JS55_9GAMM